MGSANITQEKPVNSTPILNELGEKLHGIGEKMDISTTNSRPPGGAELSGEEEVATTKFLENVNKWRAARELAELSWTSAVKFLMARKFNVDRALVLYQQHEIMRIREGLTYFDHSSGPLQAELKRGKFTVLPCRDPNGATIALFNLSLHEPSEVTHQTVLQCVVFQLDVALEELETQRNGLVFVYNMSSSKYSNFDYELSQKMLNLLKGCYPARLKKVLIVTAPLWFKAPFKVLRLFVKEKLRDRVFTVSSGQLQLHVESAALPKHLGGECEVQHNKWLENCKQVTALLTMTYSTSQYREPMQSASSLPDQDLLGITNGLDQLSFDDEECEDDDITEPIAPCTSLSPTLGRENGPEFVVPVTSGGPQDTSVLVGELGAVIKEAQDLSKVSQINSINGIDCVSGQYNSELESGSDHVTLIETNGGEEGGGDNGDENREHIYNSIINDGGTSLDEFIVHVRN